MFRVRASAAPRGSISVSEVTVSPVGEITVPFGSNRSSLAGAWWSPADIRIVATSSTLTIASAKCLERLRPASASAAGSATVLDGTARIDSAAIAAIAWANDFME